MLAPLVGSLPLWDPATDNILSVTDEELNNGFKREYIPMSSAAKAYFKSVWNGSLPTSLRYRTPLSSLKVIAPIASIKTSSIDPHTIASELDGFGGTAKHLFPYTQMLSMPEAGMPNANGTCITFSPTSTTNSQVVSFNITSLSITFPPLQGGRYAIQRGERVELHTTIPALLLAAIALLEDGEPIPTGEESLTLSDLQGCLPYFSAENADTVLVGVMRTSRSSQDILIEVLGAATDVISGGATILGVATGSFSAAADMQLIGALAFSTCADPHLRAAFGSYRTLSPFALTESYLGVIAGNAIAYAGIFVLQLLSLVIVRLIKGDATQWAQLTALVWFPGITLSAIAALHTGTGYAASQLVSLPDPSDDAIAVGAVAIAYTLLTPLVIALFAFKMIPRAYQTYDDRVAFATSKGLPLWSLHFIAKGIITPQTTRQSYQTIITNCRHPQAFWPTYPFWGPIIVMIGGFIHPSTITGCVALFSSLAAAFFAIAIVVVVAKPLRSNCYNVLEAIGKLLNALIFLCGAVGVWSNEAQMAQRASNAAVILGIVQIVLAVLRLIYSFIVRYFDTIFDKDLVRLHVVWAHTTDSDATAKRFALPDDGDDDFLRQVALTKADADEVDLSVGAPIQHHGDDVSTIQLDLPHKEGGDHDFDSDSMLRSSDGVVEVPVPMNATAALDAQKGGGGTSSFSSTGSDGSML